MINNDKMDVTWCHWRVICMDEYWESRYRNAGDSGTAPENSSEVIRLLEENDLPMRAIIDLGCGDMKMWEGYTFSSFFGVDSSPAVINRNKTHYPNYRFEVGDISAVPFPINAPTVTCLNVLFHVRDDKAFLRILKNLTIYSTQYIIIKTWKTNPLNEPAVKKQILQNLMKRRKFLSWLRVVLSSNIQDDMLYQKYRSFDEYSSIFSENGFRLLKEIKIDAHGVFYIFQRFD